MDLADIPRHRPLAFDKMEALIKEMQDPETGVPVRSQKIFLSLIPSAFMGYDLVEWLMDRFNLDEASNIEAINLGNQLCQHGYFFPVNDLKNLVLKDDSSLYRFQSPYYWPWTGSRAGAALGPDNVEYAIYLVKRTLRNKQRHALDDYEQEALANLRRNLAAKWDFITMQANEQVRLAKERKKGEKIVSDSQERAYWRVARPPPGVASALEPCPVPVRARQPRPRRRTRQQLQCEIELLKASVERTRAKTSVAVEALITYSETFAPYDPWLTPPQPSNPWVSDDTLFWQINSPLVEVPTEKRVQRWALSIDELVNDPTGLQEFTAFLRKEYSHENIRFWLAVMDLRRSSAKAIPGKLRQIYEEFLKPGAPCEINIDGATAEKVAENIKGGSRYALDHAADHVYNLLLKKDCYPRFVRSDHFQRLLAEGRNVHQKKKFFNFGGQVKKKQGSTGAPPSGALSRRRGSDRSLSGSAHELALCAAQPPHPPADAPPHSHSQSNLADIRDPTALEESGDEVAPWESCGSNGGGGARRRQDSAADSGSSSSEPGGVSERRRLPQQSTLDGGLRGAPPPLRRLSAVEPRHLPPPEPRRPAARAPSPTPPPAPHPTPTISVSSAPDDEPQPEERDDPPSVFTPTNEPDTTLCDARSESEVSEPTAGCSRDATRTIAREPSLRETSPASSKLSTDIAELPGISPDVVLDPVECQGPPDEVEPSVASAVASDPEAPSEAPVASSSTSEPSAKPVTPMTPASEDAATDVAKASDVVTVVHDVANISKDVANITKDAAAISSPKVTTGTKSTPDVATPSPKAGTVNTSTPDISSASSSLAHSSSNVASATSSTGPVTSNIHSHAGSSLSMTKEAPNKVVKLSNVGSTMTPDREVLKLEPCIAPLAEAEDLCPDDEKAPTPDSQDVAEVSQTGVTSASKRDSHEEQKRNDVCPWEDENSCESEAPFVKTYATLGYL